MPYVDGKLKVFDVNIFTPDEEVHVGGWGTILVATMHFGGGPYKLDPDSDPDGNDDDDITLRSAVIVFDITDPDEAPRLLAEFTDEDLGFTTSHIDVVKFRKPNANTGSYDDPDLNQWYLAVGSGPQGENDAKYRSAQLNAISNKNSKLFMFDLKTKTLKEHDRGLTNSFIGGVNAVDWNRDYNDDAIYFGTVAGTPDNPAGQLRRELLSLNGTTLSLAGSPLLNVTDQAFSGVPFTRVDDNYDAWVFAGTGRFYVDADIDSKTNNTYYGIKENKDANGVIMDDAISVSNMVDTTNLRIYTNGYIETRTGANPVTLSTGEKIIDNDELSKAISDNSGWYMNLSPSGARNFTETTMYSTSLLFSVYTPNGEACSENNGTSRLFQREFFTGVPPTYTSTSYIDTSATVNNEDGESGALIADSIPLGEKLFGAPDEEGLIVNQDGELEEIKLGLPPIKAGRQSWREIPQDW